MASILNYFCVFKYLQKVVSIQVYILTHVVFNSPGIFKTYIWKVESIGFNDRYHLQGLKNNFKQIQHFMKGLTKLPEHVPLWFLFQKGIPSKHRGSPPDWSRAPRPESYIVCYETGDLLTHGQSPICGKIQMFLVIRKQKSC